MSSRDSVISHYNSQPSFKIIYLFSQAALSMSHGLRPTGFFMPTAHGHAHAIFGI